MSRDLQQAVLNRVVCKQSLASMIQEVRIENDSDRKFSKGVVWSSRQNTGKNNFLGPKMTHPDPVISFNWT